LTACAKSGAPVEQKYAVAYELEDGQLVRIRYLDYAETVETGGLRE
jgi:ketosteroid isomerase-like protein